MDLHHLQAQLRDFAAERHWQPFHTPKNLAMALMVEAAELAEVFQWMTPEQSVAASGDPATRERIADEVLDQRTRERRIHPHEQGPVHRDLDDPGMRVATQQGTTGEQMAQMLKGMTTGGQ